MSEILGALFKYLAMLIGVAAVVAVLNMAFNSDKTGKFASNVTQLSSNAQAFYSGQSSFATLTDAVAIAAKLAPEAMISGSALVNPWGGIISIAKSTNAWQFDVTAGAVPQDACAKVLPTIGTSLAGLKVNNSSVALPVDPGTAVTACNTSSNTIVLTYDH